MSQLIAMGTPEGIHRLRTEATKACHHLCVGALFERDIQRFSAPRSGVEATLLHFAPLLRMLHLVDVHRPLLLSEAGLLEKLCCLFLPSLPRLSALAVCLCLSGSESGLSFHTFRLLLFDSSSRSAAWHLLYRWLFDNGFLWHLLHLGLRLHSLLFLLCWYFCQSIPISSIVHLSHLSSST